MDFIIKEEVRKKIENQGLKISEIQKIIEESEKCKHKFISNDKSKCLVKGPLGNLTIYVEYNNDEILNIYTHKMKIIGVTGDINEPVNYDDSTEWVCFYCNKPAVYRNIDMEYFGVIRPGPGIICTSCLDSYVSEGVSQTIKKAEDTLEEKRG